jgi:hypothetical protein
MMQEEEVLKPGDDCGDGQQQQAVKLLWEHCWQKLPEWV